MWYNIYILVVVIHSLSRGIADIRLSVAPVHSSAAAVIVESQRDPDPGHGTVISFDLALHRRVELYVNMSLAVWGDIFAAHIYSFVVFNAVLYLSQRPVPAERSQTLMWGQRRQLRHSWYIRRRHSVQHCTVIVVKPEYIIARQGYAVHGASQVLAVAHNGHHCSLVVQTLIRWGDICVYTVYFACYTHLFISASFHFYSLSDNGDIYTYGCIVIYNLTQKEDK